MIEARRVPPLNPANAFTLLRVALVPVFAWLLVVRKPSLPVVAAIVFIVAAATDGLDGFLARRWNLVSSFGAFLDPLADKLLVGTALIPLATDGRISWWAVGVIGVREFVIGIGLRLVLRSRGKALPASFLAKVKTNAQLLAILVATLRPPGDLATAVVVWAAVALTIVSGVQYLVELRRGRVGEAWR
jgi:CDP-diacylglycerol---glycerol-3-phosphate 3-phosphatidyltransferase